MTTPATSLPTPRVGGFATYRKPGQPKRRALIEWIYPDGTMRVRNDIGGRRCMITPADCERATLAKGQHVKGARA